jgi:hypothetical protein
MKEGGEAMADGANQTDSADGLKAQCPRVEGKD